MKKLLFFTAVSFLISACHSRQNELDECIRHFMSEGDTREEAEERCEIAQSEHGVRNSE